MNVSKTLLLIFVAGALGGLSSGILVWGLGRMGITPATGFNMTPDLSVEWLFRRIFASGLWGIIFLIPIFRHSPLIKGAVLGILPWLSSVLFVFPYRMDVGFFGLDLGLGTPFWTLFFGCFWGVTGTVFLARFHPKPMFS